MASTINATPTSSGLIQTADNTGVLALQTGGTTAITINATQQVALTGNLTVTTGSVSTPAISPTGDSNTGIFFPAADTIAFAEGGVEAMRIDSSGNVGIGVTPTGTGGCLQLKSGITFPATQSASSDANTLDDYEEGTWTPQLSSDLGSTAGKTYSAQVGKYTKVGNVVYYSFSIAMTNKGSSNVNEANLIGFPFTFGSSAAIGTSYIQQWANVGTSSIWFSAVPKNGTTAAYISVTTAAATGSSLYISTAYTDTTFFRGGGFYYID